MWSRFIKFFHFKLGVGLDDFLQAMEEEDIYGKIMRYVDERFHFSWNMLIWFLN